MQIRRFMDLLGVEGAEPPISPFVPTRGYAGLGTCRCPSQPADRLEPVTARRSNTGDRRRFGTSSTPGGESVLYSCRGL